MRTIQTLAMGLILGFTGIAVAQGESCPDFSGQWQGSCTYEGTPSHELKLGLDAAGFGSDKNTIEIVQGIKGEHTCAIVKIDERTLSLGNLKTETVSSSSSALPSVSTSEGAEWEDNKLQVVAAGIIRINEEFTPYQGQESYRLDNQGHLVNSLQISLKETTVQVSCSYTRL